jgi:uncharacterized protein (DUF2237 family)
MIAEDGAWVSHSSMILKKWTKSIFLPNKRKFSMRRTNETLRVANSALYYGMAKNVLGTALQACSTDPMTGFFRDGCCNTTQQDRGMHTVCAVMTDDFLIYSRSMGNDLITPRPEYDFPGLKAGDRWCLCLGRWLEAHDAGFAPPVVLEATHASVTEFADLEIWQSHAASL